MGEFCTIHLNDECPALGSGKRLVFIDKIGRKWVTLACPFDATSARVSRKVWSETRGLGYQPAKPRKGVIRDALRRHVPRDLPNKSRKALKARILQSLTT